VATIWTESAEAAFLPLLPEGHEVPELDLERLRAVLGGPAGRLLLAEEDCAALGYTAFGSSRDGDAPPDVGEVWTFFVRPSAWRRGVGSALMSRALADLAGLGHHHATVWSFADNARANRFYEHHGFERDGEERREDAWARILEVRYRRPTI
jgi:GNAT superfamily N-acetyltransferase